MSSFWRAFDGEVEYAMRCRELRTLFNRMNFEVRFYFDSDERLREVGLSPEGGRRGSPVSRPWLERPKIIY